MIKVLLLFLVLIAGVILGPMLAGHQGYVLIRTDNYDINTSVTGLAIIYILSVIVLFVIASILRRIFHTGAHTRGWFLGRKRRRASQQTKAALLKLAEGDHRQVEKLMSRHADHAEQPMVNYLIAAEAAQQRGDEIRANQHLERAAELAESDDQLPVEITRVRLQLARNENHAARHGIDKLLEIAPRHPEVLRLAEQAYLRTSAWSPLLEILPAIEKVKIADETHITAIQQQAWIGLMDQAMADQGNDGLKDWWRNQSRKTRQKTVLQVAMAEHLIECDDNNAAQDIVLKGLKHQYDDSLVMLMPRLKSGEPEKLEKALHQLLKAHSNNPLIHSTLGQLLMQRGEWQQAADALRAALKQRPDTFDYAWLADSLDRLHQPEEAALMRREGLLLTLKNNPGV